MTVIQGLRAESRPVDVPKDRGMSRFLDACTVDLPVEVDGNVSFENIPKMVSAGANILVGGTSSVFQRSASRAENIQQTRQAITLGLAEKSIAICEIYCTWTQLD